MNPGPSTESYPAFARIGLRETPEKILNQVTCSNRESNPGHLVSRPDALTVTPQVEGDNAGEMSPGSSTESCPAFARIGLRENPGKPQPGNLPQPGFEPWPGVNLVSWPDALTVTLPQNIKEIGLEVNPEKIKYMIMSRDENIVRNGNIKIGNLSFEEVEKFKYLGATVTNINDTREEIKHRINMGNASYYSVEKLLSSSLLPKNLKVRIYKTVILPVVLYSYETWTLTLREEHRRVRWTGHVARMGESRNAYRVLVARPGGKRPLGRPRRRWEDNIKIDLREVGYEDREWINLSQDRDQWRAYARAGGNEPPGSLKASKWAGHVARMGESRNVYRVLAGRREGKRPLGRPTRRWEDNIKMDLREVGYDDREWINLAQDRDQWRAYVWAAMNLRVPEKPNMGGVIIGGRRIKFIRFADDMPLLAEEEMILRNMLLELNDSCEQYRIKINANKTNTMVKGRKIKK
ncbi:hypothetical protein ANN_25050, partial [Periplaneta americana]